MINSIHWPHVKRWTAVTALGAALAVSGAAVVSGAERDSTRDDEDAVAALDTQYQQAVKDNDAETIERIVAPEFVLVTGRGTVLHKADLLNDARTKDAVYDDQEDSNRTVRLLGDTAVVTGLLWAKGKKADGTAFDYKLWFSDVYQRTRRGWKYTFAQSSIPLSK